MTTMLTAELPPRVGGIPEQDAPRSPCTSSQVADEDGMSMTARWETSRMSLRGASPATRALEDDRQSTNDEGTRAMVELSNDGEITGNGENLRITTSLNPRIPVEVDSVTGNEQDEDGPTPAREDQTRMIEVTSVRGDARSVRTATNVAREDDGRSGHGRNHRNDSRTTMHKGSEVAR